MSTYVQITRDEFEAWLNSLGLTWRVKAPQTGGVYQLFLSPDVTIEINSTTGRQDQVMALGRASMSLWLASRHTGRVLNGKAMGQSHFARTTNWRTNWVKGVDRMREAYIKAKDFYDTLAQIEDFAKYKQDTLALIESRANWRANAFLLELHGKVSNGGVLSKKQLGAVNAMPVEGAEHELLPKLRVLWTRARASGDSWTMDFVKSLADQIKHGRELSQRQLSTLDAKLGSYGLSD